MASHPATSCSSLSLFFSLYDCVFSLGTLLYPLIVCVCNRAPTVKLKKVNMTEIFANLALSSKSITFTSLQQEARWPICILSLHTPPTHHSCIPLICAGLSYVLLNTLMHSTPRTHTRRMLPSVLGSKLTISVYIPSSWTWAKSAGIIGNLY